MKHTKNEPYIKTGLAAFCVIAGSIVFYYLIFHNSSFRSGIDQFFGILRPILYGVVLAYILNPIMQFLENHIYLLLRKWKVTMNRTVHLAVRFFSVFAAGFLLFFVIYGLVSLLLPQLIDSIRNIIRNYPIYEANVIEWVNTTFGSDDASQTTNHILSYADRIYDWAVGRLPEVDSILSNVTQYLFGFVKLILNLVLGVIIAIYILVSKEMLAAKAKRLMYAFLPLHTGNRILHNIRFVDEKFGGFIIGKIIDSAIIGVLCYILMQIMKMPYPVLIAVVIGVTNIIPFFGPFIGAIPCAVLVFVVSPLKSLYFVIFILLLQQFDGNILGPRILGNSTGLSGFMVVIAIVICNGIFGVGGAFFGVPLTATIVGIIQAYIRKKATKKGLERDIVFYDDLAYIDEETLRGVRTSEMAAGTSLYDRIKRQSEELSREGVKRFMKHEEEADYSVNVSGEADPESETDTEDPEAAPSSDGAGSVSAGGAKSVCAATKKAVLSAAFAKKNPHRAGRKTRTSDVPVDPVNVTEEEAASNHNLPLVP